MPPQKILVAEDESLVAHDISHTLQKMGYVVPDIAASGEEAVEMARLHQPALILMDVKLRGKTDGIEAVSRIQKSQRIPVIYLTAHSDAATLNRAKATSPAGYLLKPIDKNQLSISVEMALYLFDTEERARQQQERYYTILRTALDGVLVMGPDGAIQDVNEAYCRLTGYERAELLALAWKDLETNPDWQLVEKYASSGSWRFTSVHRKKDGSLVDVAIGITCLPEQNLLFAFAHDITGRKQREAEILHLNASLEKRAQENEALYQTERAHRELIELLVEASRVVASTLNIDVVLDRIMDQVGCIVRHDVCNIVLLTGEKPEVVRTRGYERFDAGSFVETFVFPLAGVPIRQQMVETREPMVVPDVRVEQRWQLSEEKIWLRSYVAAPICVQNRVIGLLNIGISAPKFYNESHGRVLMAFANHAAIAFQNAQLFEEAQNAAKRLEMLSRRLLDIQETERRYIARELHDEIGQALTAARLNLQSLGRFKNEAAFEHKLTEGLKILELALNQVRNISMALHPSMLDDLGLLPALRWYADREAQWGNFEVQLQADDFGQRLDNHLELVCFRVVQEALTNVMRHASASQVVVELRRDGEQLVLSIQDNGCGFDVSKALTKAEKGHSLGLLGMRERVLLANGRLEIQSGAEAGTRICAILPYREAVNGEEHFV